MTRLHLALDLARPALRDAADDLAAWLSRAGHSLAVVDGLESVRTTTADVAVVLADRPVDVATEEALLAAAGRGVALLLVGPTLVAASSMTRLVDAAGVLATQLLPRHEVRVRPGPNSGDLTARWSGDLLLDDAWPLVDKVADDVEVLLTANHHLVDHPVATLRSPTRVAVLTLGATPESLSTPAYAGLVHRLVRRMTGASDRPAVGVGLLGYGAIGHEHNKAIGVVPGLQLVAVCDSLPARVAAARVLAPDLRAAEDGDALLGDDEVELIVVSTPPNTHAEWALRALEAGKHVVVEKPFCLTTEEADAIITAAAAAKRTLAVYQNRRWDADYLALKQVIRSGDIGELFSLETFIGGYGHPCNYWHSDERVSGGAIYDWGSHYIDWILDLIPQPVQWVSATTHKRVWHDVSNADHTRVLLHFADGVEADFVHSDIAAGQKPKWLALGTRGAVRGDWRPASVLARDAVGNLAEDRLALAESPAELSIWRPDGAGGVSMQQLSYPGPPPQPFHRELAEHLLSGAPMSVTPEGSRRNIEVMQAATRSAKDAGRPVSIP
ncbi:MAG TPA: Gfo/Idh/MocA family oxidoreductase [Mycobacteriales bacterium]|nr:Gfo/Idh/MocA family oxidoreductase [Mycobacteriales bacterium]